MVLGADIQCLAHAGPSANAVCSCASIPSMGTDKVLEYWWRTNERGGCKDVIVSPSDLYSQHGLVHTYGCC